MKHRAPRSEPTKNENFPDWYKIYAFKWRTEIGHGLEHYGLDEEVVVLLSLGLLREWKSNSSGFSDAALATGSFEKRWTWNAPRICMRLSSIALDTRR